ncbi:hypothetical protein L798_13820 [Zootermopsis nevadensis]|uniref:Uncharacterized protein n=1 Tax=Zootermopsis nevadensis TaxID=136037 RepID=A0A067QT78_ZOONE|nr:hypothetical protein L798_13820 [Zootermopsis nevadensis]
MAVPSALELLDRLRIYHLDGATNKSFDTMSPEELMQYRSAGCQRTLHLPLFPLQCGLLPTSYFHLNGLWTIVQISAAFGGKFPCTWFVRVIRFPLAGLKASDKAGVRYCVINDAPFGSM